MRSRGLFVSLALGATCAVAPAQVQSAKLLASAPEDYGSFGAAVSLSGGRALIGVTGEDVGSISSGAAHVLERVGEAWVHAATLAASDGADYDTFGSDVALSGTVALIGAQNDDDLGSGSGSAYVFELVGASWIQTAKLTASNGAADDEFGYSVALQGDRALVGAYEADGDFPNTGAAYVFERVAGTWVEVAKLAASDGVAWQRFGYDVALDGPVAIIGSPHSGGAVYEAGAAYVFGFHGGAWSQSAKLVASDMAAQDYFGRTVSISGSRALVGALWDDDQGPSSGSAYVFEQHGGAWTETKIHASDGSGGFEFGNDVIIDGDRLLVGTTAKDPDKATSYLFELHGGSWVERGKLLPWAVGSTGNHARVTLALEGDLALVGVPDDSVGATFWSGSAAMFDLSGAGAPIEAAPSSLSLAAGGMQFIALHPGTAFAGWLHLVLGTASGTAPGIPLPGGAMLPLNPDPYFAFTLANPGQAPLAESLGFLGATGQAVSAFALPAGTDPALAGLQVHHAYLLLDPATLAPSFASGAVLVTLGP